MSDPTDPLATVRAALDDVRAWCVECDEHVLTDGNSGERCDWLVFIYGEEDANAARDTAIDRLVDEGLAVDDDAAAKMVRVVTLIPAAPAIADLCREVEALRTAMRTISGIRDSIIGAQAVNWSEHVYPLVAALDGAGFRGVDYETARANLGTLLERIATLEAELAQVRAHRCGGIVLSADDADRIAALLEEQPGPTPAMLALFDKAKEE